jgi:hypothetical protein
MKRKKLLALLICCITLFLVALTGCEDKNDNSSRKKSKKSTSSESSLVEDSSSIEDSESSSEEDSSSKSELVNPKGAINGSTYENQYFNLKFTLPEGATFSQNSMCDFMCIASDKATNMIVSANILPSGYSEDDYIKATQDGLKNQFSSYAPTFDVKSERKDIAGISCKQMYMQYKIMGVNVSQEYYCYKKDNSIISIIISYNENSGTYRDQLLNALTPLK